MTLEEQLCLAIEVASEVHKAQVDRNGIPYIGHVMRVSNTGTTIQEKIVGALHDVIEDSQLTIEDLQNKGFDSNILDAVHAMTHYDDETYDEYIDRIIQNSIATRVKINDLVDNMDLRRLHSLDESAIFRVRKYFDAYKKIIQSFS